jgi:hypothetical protein
MSEGASNYENTKGISSYIKAKYFFLLSKQV